MSATATVERVAAYMKLDPDWLRSRFAVDNEWDGMRIPYPYRERLREWVETAHPTTWRGNGECTAYIDEETLIAARARGELVIVEGESDRWTLEAHGIPALGVPGATMTNCIAADDAAGIERIYVIREPDDAGEKFVTAVAERLREIGFTGEPFAIDLQVTCGVKDPSDLHVRNPQAFDAKWQRVIESSKRILLAWPEIYPRPVLHPLALHGCAGEFVQLIAPQSEAAEAALLLQFLAVAGIAMGANAYVMTESTRHYPRLNLLLLGPTAHGRKGTAADHIKRAFTIADEDFVRTHFASGLVSGEGMYRRCAPQGEQTPVNERRVVFFEPEFAKVLEVSKREGNSLSANIRELYDSGSLEVLRKTDPLKVNDVHAAVVAHCTVHEYRAELDKVSMANGFANRFLLAYVERANILPFGGEKLTDHDLNSVSGRVNAAIRFGGTKCQVSWSADARDLYARFYRLCAEEGRLYPALIGAMLARLETNVLRAALVYALLDGSSEIGVDHLRAAIAVGAYARSSTFYAFGPALGDKTAEAILGALRERNDPMTRTDIRREIFHDNLPADEVRAALDFLAARGLVEATTEATGGRSRDSFRAIGPGDAKREKHADDSLLTLITSTSPPKNTNKASVDNHRN